MSVFSGDDDRIKFLTDVRRHATKQEVRILAYCLMDNHAHFILIPGKVYSFGRMLGPLNTMWSRRLSKTKNSVGRNLQGRYFSAPMDDGYTIKAITYVHLNPVRANMVSQATDYAWSSAAKHCGNKASNIIDDLPEWREHIALAAQELLLNTESDSHSKANDASRIRSGTSQNIPIGSELFIRSIESLTGRSLRHRSRGRPKKPVKNGVTYAPPPHQI